MAPGALRLPTKRLVLVDLGRLKGDARRLLPEEHPARRIVEAWPRKMTVAQLEGRLDDLLAVLEA